MPDAERDDAPTTPPKAIRPEHPVSGPDPEISSVEVEVSVTELSLTEPSARNPDTLMSLPKPTPRAEHAADTRVLELEDRLEGFETRLRALERSRDPLAPTKATPWWFWLLFLVGLAVTWRILEVLK